MRKSISWDELWMGMAKLVSQRSKDPNTQVGAVIVSPDNEHIVVGYNGFEAGELETPELWESPEKYKHVIHAEDNVFRHAEKAGTKVSGWTLYITHPPCSKCSPKVIEAGIKRVLYCFLPNEKSIFEYQQTFEKYEKAGIEVLHFSL